MTPKVGVAKVTCPTFEAMGQIPAFHLTYFLLLLLLILHMVFMFRIINYSHQDDQVMFYNISTDGTKWPLMC